MLWQWTNNHWQSMKSDGEIPKWFVCLIFITTHTKYIYESFINFDSKWCLQWQYEAFKINTHGESAKKIIKRPQILI